MESGESGKYSVGKYMTHPAFLAFQSVGMWVGKFETGYKEATTKEEAQKNENNPDKVQIKPNVYSWRSIQVANAYLSSYNYKRNLDSHMMKNTEWGAVAYLQHSRYGSGTSVIINNNSDYKTGYSTIQEPTCGTTGDNRNCNKFGITHDITRPWNTDIGVLASTTGNISGIYDMSGGAWEYKMGVLKSQDGLPCSGRDATYNSGFNGPYCNTTGEKADGIKFPIDHKYYDVYEYAAVDEKYNRRILGDATGEMGPFSLDSTFSWYKKNSWYDDESRFIFNGYPWFGRGGSCKDGTASGIFSFNANSGDVWSTLGFRIVLVI